MFISQTYSKMSRTITLNTNVDTLFGKTLILRGFSESVPWKQIKNSNDYHCKSIVQDIVKLVKQKNFNTIVWGGDLYRSDSFTHIVLELMNSLPENVQFVSFKYDDIGKFADGDQKNCEIGWCQMASKNSLGIFLYTVSVPDDLNLVEKNTLLTKHIFQHVTKKSNKTSIMYLGGMKNVTDEMRNLYYYVKNDYLTDKINLIFIDIPSASFLTSMNTGLPHAQTTYLGNSITSGDPLYYLPGGFYENKVNKNIYLKFSKVKYIIEYKYEK